MSHRRNVMAGLCGLLALGSGGCRCPGEARGAPALDLAPQSGARYQCGPTTLASVLSFHGVPVPEETISLSIYSPTARGVLLMDMARFAREQGFAAATRTGTHEDLLRAVEDRNPPIVLLDLGLGQLRIPHFTAVTGGTDGGLFLLGPHARNEFITLPQFERQWKKAGNQYLVVTPPSPARSR